MLCWTSQGSAGKGMDSTKWACQSLGLPKAENLRTCVLTAPGRSSVLHTQQQALRATSHSEMSPVLLHTGNLNGSHHMCSSPLLEQNLKCTWMKHFTDLLPLAFHTHILETSFSQMSSSTRNMMLHSGAAAGGTISRYCRSLFLGHQMSPTAPLPSEVQP